MIIGMIEQTDADRVQHDARQIHRHQIRCGPRFPRRPEPRDADVPQTTGCSGSRRPSVDGSPSGAWGASFEHPFVQQLAEGTLDAARFRFYQMQDARYLEAFADAASLISTRCPDPVDKLWFVDAARMALIVTAAGGLCLLAGVLLLGRIVGSYDLDKVLAAADRIQASAGDRRTEGPDTRRMSVPVPVALGTAVVRQLVRAGFDVAHSNAVRHDFGDGPSQTFAAIGVQGLSPYMFEVGATAYVGESGQTAASIEVEYETLFTNRLILQSMVDAELHGKDDERRGIGSGLGTIEVGLRLRYEVTRQFAPYIGVVHERAFGDTADFRRADGEDIDNTRVVAGLRLWF